MRPQNASPSAAVHPLPAALLHAKPPAAHHSGPWRLRRHAALAKSRPSRARPRCTRRALEVLTPATDSAGLTIKSEYAGHVVEFAGPMRVTAIEEELSDDILWHRRASCEASASSSFAECTRFYRAYVLACTSMVEAFLNRPLLLLGHLRQQVEVIERLHRPLPFDERIELWVKTFCIEPLSELKRTTAWGHFQELREERNHLVHATRPQLGVEIRALERGLNLVREGVGGFMRKLRSMQTLPTTPFIEKLESAPLVTFQPKSKKNKKK